MRGSAGIVLFLLVASSASASWMAAGGVEPSTPWDDAVVMYDAPDRDKTTPPRIYFQGFQSVEQLTLNPNPAATNSRLLLPGAVHHRALLGLWKDCNGDGYVGSAESALQDYHAILINTSICPVGSLFNDGQWVSEMMAVGMVDPCEFGSSAGPGCEGPSRFHKNERVFYANGTMVWADQGVPGSAPFAECPLAPLPPGTTSGTGALLQYADCHDGRFVARSVNGLDNGGELGLRFENVDRPSESSSRLNVVLPATLFSGPKGPGLLDEGTGSPAFTTWDCSEPRAFVVRDPTGGSLSGVTIQDPTGNRLTGRQPPVPVVGSVTIFEDHDGNAATPGQRRVDIGDGDQLVWAPALDVNARDPPASVWDAAEHVADGPRGDCDPSTTSPLRAAAPRPLVEGGVPQVDEGRKDRTSLVFTFYDGHRGLNENADFVTGPGTPSDGGLLYRRNDRGGAGPMWNATSVTLQEPQLFTRNSIEPNETIYWTYYARIGNAFFDAGFQAPAGRVSQTYASDPCRGMPFPANGWVCDPARWWRDAFDRDVRPRYGNGVPYAPVPGDAYHVRDVDCYDGHLALGVAYANAAFGEPRRC